MRLATVVYRKMLSGGPIGGRLFAAARALMISAFGDPPCVMRVHGRLLRMPLSHALPFYAARNPLYDTLPGRLCAFLRESRSAMCIVDIGANVGDSIAACGAEADDRVLAVEPNHCFARFLRDNWPDAQQVRLCDVFCSSTAGEGDFVIEQHAGTASIRPSAGGVRMRQMPLDSIVEHLTDFARPDFLKIDTDGHDFEVLSGAMGMLARCRPAVLFECDVFGRVDYTMAVHATLNAIADCGYHRFLAYDHLGHLIGAFPLRGGGGFDHLLFHQLVAGRSYFDLLVLREGDFDAFVRREVEFFAQRCVSAPLRAAAIQAGGLTCSAATTAA